jgi:hypothetical protein
MPLTHPDPVRAELETGPRTGGSDVSLAERVFAGLFTNWQLTTFGGLHIAAPKGAPVYAGTLSDVIVAVAGAATRDRCPNGTGWPAGTSR